MTRKVLIPIAVGFIVLVVAWYLLAWSPATKRLHSAEGARTAAQSTEASLAAQQMALVAKARLLPAERAKAAYLSGQLPSTVDVPGFIDQLTGIADVTHVALQDVTQSVTPPASTTGLPATVQAAGGSPVPPDVGILSLEFSVTGGFAQTMSFISEVQRLPRFVSVATVGMAQTDQTLTTALTASAYFDSAQFPKTQ